MKTIDFKNGTVRAVVTFVLAFAVLEILFWILYETFGLDFFGKRLLLLIGAGWLAYWVWKKTEYGYY